MTTPDEKVTSDEFTAKQWERIRAFIVVLALVGMTACVSTKQALVAPCKMAIVNPVSGNAECVEPRGAAVDPPPPRPAPTKEFCNRHGDLGLEVCRSTSPVESPTG